jgi:hypothetical protein
MQGRNAMKKWTLLVALVAVSALGQHRRSVTPPAVVLDRNIVSWTLDVRTSGGFAPTPSLRSGVIVRNTGDVTRLDYLGQSVCTGTTTSDELDRLNAALDQAHPETWASNYARPSNPTGCCDQIRTTVKLTRTSKDGQSLTYETYWFDDHDPLPADLTTLAQLGLGLNAAQCTAITLTGDWSVSIVEDGGFAYRLHRLDANSNGAVSVQPNPHSTCKRQIADSETRQLGDLVLRADAAAWAKSYADPANPTGCCDQVHTTITLTRTEAGSIKRTYTTDWFSSHPPLPLDLVGIYARFFGNANEPAALFQRFASACGPLF